VVDAQASFLGKVRFDDLIDIEMTIAKLGNSSMTSTFEEKRDGDVLVRGRVVHVFVNSRTMEKKEIPADVRERLGPWTDQ
jgi:acyl-CoA thioester hydrolase